MFFNLTGLTSQVAGSANLALPSNLGQPPFDKAKVLYRAAQGNGTLSLSRGTSAEPNQTRPDQPSVTTVTEMSMLDTAVSGGIPAELVAAPVPVSLR